MKLDDLFKWQKELTIKGPDGEPFVPEGEDEPLVLYQRIVGDADLSRARKEALRASRQLRKNLRDPDSAEYAAMVPEYEEMDKSTLINAILITEAGDLRERAEGIANLPKYPTPPPNDASLEAKEEYQHEMDTYDERRNEAIVEQMDKLIESRKEELSNFSRKKLIDIFSDSIIGHLAQRKMIDTFNMWCAYLGTYVDKQLKERAFSSYEAFDNATAQLKDQILDGYVSLEMSGDSIKK